MNQGLFTIIDIKNEWVEANLKENQLKEVRVGQKVTLKSDVNNKEYVGFVSAIGGGSGSSLSLLPAQNATGNWIKIVQRVPVRIELDKENLKNNGFLPIGTSMRVKIDKTVISDIKSDNKQELELDYNEKELEEEIQKIIKSSLK